MEDYITNQQSENAVPEHEHDLRWYIVQTYTGYENKVAADIMAAAKSRGLEEEIVATAVPVIVDAASKETKSKSSSSSSGKKSTKAPKVTKKFPGYTMVKMCMAHNSTWGLVRNITGVMNFLGIGNTPVPLTDEEVDRMGIDDPEVRRNINIDFVPGDNVQVTAASFTGFKGKVVAVDEETLEVRVEIDMFGKPTQLTVSYRDLVKI